MKAGIILDRYGQNVWIVILLAQVIWAKGSVSMLYNSEPMCRVICPRLQNTCTIQFLWTPFKNTRKYRRWSGFPCLSTETPAGRAAIQPHLALHHEGPQDNASSVGERDCLSSLQLIWGSSLSCLTNPNLNNIQQQIDHVPLALLLSFCPQAQNRWPCFDKTAGRSWGQTAIHGPKLALS